MQILPDDISIDPAFIIQNHITPYVINILMPLVKGVSAPTGNGFSMNKILMPLLTSYPVKKLTVIDLGNLDASLKNESLRLLVETIHSTLMIAINEIEKIPDNPGVQIGKRLQKWGQFVGIKSEKLQLARLVWEIKKKGIFSAEFLEPIRKSLNTAAGYVPPPVLTQEEEEKFFDALTDLPPKAASKKPKPVALPESGPGPDQLVRRKKNQSINIHHDYENVSSVTTPLVISFTPKSSAQASSKPTNPLGEAQVIPYSDEKNKKLTISTTK
jgi:hypothetical protein